MVSGESHTLQSWKKWLPAENCMSFMHACRESYGCKTRWETLNSIRRRCLLRYKGTRREWVPDGDPFSLSHANTNATCKHLRLVSWIPMFASHVDAHADVTCKHSFNVISFLSTLDFFPFFGKVTAQEKRGHKLDHDMEQIYRTQASELCNM